MRLLFQGVMRPKELFKLQRLHIKVPGHALMSRAFVAVLSIADPNNKSYMCRIQARIIRCVDTIAWLTWWVPHMTPTSFLWPARKAVFQKFFQQALSFYGIDKIGYTLSGCPAGKATEMFEAGEAIHAIQLAGGWGLLQSL